MPPFLKLNIVDTLAFVANKGTTVEIRLPSATFYFILQRLVWLILVQLWLR